MNLDTVSGQIGLFEDNAEYDRFTKKFKPKKTTDDCYTPPIVYDAVCDWVENEYGVDRRNFVRPFYPGGDYEHETYPEGCVVVDNPPFSIITRIQRFYLAHGIKFFLFAPTLTLFSGKIPVEYLPCGVSITYENSANVNTSFVTNLGEMRVRSCPSLYQAVYNANIAHQRTLKKTLPKYSYPDHVLTATMVARWCKYGVEYSLRSDDCVFVPALDAQKAQGKTIFGGGMLLSDRAAAERAAAERAAADRASATVWTLSERERQIISTLGRFNDYSHQDLPGVPGDR